MLCSCDECVKRLRDSVRVQFDEYGLRLHVTHTRAKLIFQMQGKKIFFQQWDCFLRFSAWISADFLVDQIGIVVVFLLVPL